MVNRLPLGQRNPSFSFFYEVKGIVVSEFYLIDEFYLEPMQNGRDHVKDSGWVIYDRSWGILRCCKMLIHFLSVCVLSQTAPLGRVGCVTEHYVSDFMSEGFIVSG